MRGRRGSPRSIALIGIFALVVGIAGCGGDDGGGTQAQPGTFEGKGPITWATGKDTSGYIKSALDKWNKDHADEQVQLIELPEAADAQRQAMRGRCSRIGSGVGVHVSPVSSSRT